MNRLIKADLKRIIAKPGIYVIVTLMVLFVLIRKPADTAADQLEFYKVFFNDIGLIFISIPIFLSVYSEDFLFYSKEPLLLRQESSGSFCMYGKLEN